MFETFIEKFNTITGNSEIDDENRHNDLIDVFENRDISEVEKLNIYQTLSTEECIDTFTQFVEKEFMFKKNQLLELNKNLEIKAQKVEELERILEDNEKKIVELNQVRAELISKNAKNLSDLKTEHEITTKNFNNQITSIQSEIKNLFNDKTINIKGELSVKELCKEYSVKYNAMSKILNNIKALSTDDLGSSNISFYKALENMKDSKTTTSFKKFIETIYNVEIIEIDKKRELDMKLENYEKETKKLENLITSLKDFESQIKIFHIFDKPLGNILWTNITENKNKFDTKKFNEVLKTCYGVYGFTDLTQHNFFLNLKDTLADIVNKEKLLFKEISINKQNLEKIVAEKNNEIEIMKFKVETPDDFKFSVDHLQNEYHDRYNSLNFNELDKISLSSCKSILKNCLFLLKIPYDNIKDLSFRMKQIDAIVTVERVSFLKFIKLLQKLINDTTEMDYEKQINYIIEGKSSKYRLDEFFMFLHDSLEDLIQENELSFANTEYDVYNNESEYRTNKFKRLENSHIYADNNLYNVLDKNKTKPLQTNQMNVNKGSGSMYLEDNTNSSKDIGYKNFTNNLQNRITHYKH
ncbi:hypothetical protein QEN19_002280 [Hanseniaspora menglaensis]